MAKECEFNKIQNLTPATCPLTKCTENSAKLSNSAKLIIHSKTLKALRKALWAYKKRGACPLPSGNAKSERTYASFHPTVRKLRNDNIYLILRNHLSAEGETTSTGEGNTRGEVPD
jgi:hypothetical protein